MEIEEFNGLRGNFCINMFAKCLAGRPETADKAANFAELVMSRHGFFRTETNFLIDDGTTACFFYSPQKPAK